jgi:uncharacterized protein
MSILAILGIIFFILLYCAICIYIGYNFWVWLQLTPWRLNKWFYIGIMAFLSSSIFLGQFISFQPLKWVGGFWMAILGYSLLLLPVANLVIYFIKKRAVVYWVGLGLITFFLFVLAYGSFNAWSPIVREVDIKIDKASDLDNLKVLMASDIHLGEIVGVKHLQRLVDIVEKEQPDVVLLPGDIIDDHIEPFMEQGMGEIMAKINAPLGVYVIPGNHDYYGNDLEKMAEEMEEAGAVVLMDQSVLVDDQFYVVGRKDKTDGQRAGVDSLVQDLDRTKPILMMDHQPYDFDIAAANGIDLLLAGHTHRGQLAPAHLITGMIYENDWGYLRKEDLHTLVSSGFGTWGPPLRLGSRSEVFIINLEFAQ